MGFEEMRAEGRTARRRSAGIRRFNAAMTVVVCMAAVAIPYAVDRVLRGWWKANRLLAPFGTRMHRMQTQYRARQDSLADGAEIVALLAELIDASRPPPRAR
jgi:hypothetical protein